MLGTRVKELERHEEGVRRLDQDCRGKGGPLRITTLCRSIIWRQDLEKPGEVEERCSETNYRRPFKGRLRQAISDSRA